MKKRSKLILISISSFLLFGCGSDKDNYTGPVEGSAQIVSENKESSSSDTSTKADPPFGAKANGMFGDDKRFMARAPDVTRDAKYISSPAIVYNFGNLIVNGKGDWRDNGQPLQTRASDVRIVPFHG